MGAARLLDRTRVMGDGAKRGAPPKNGVEYGVSRPDPMSRSMQSSPGEPHFFFAFSGLSLLAFRRRFLGCCNLGVTLCNLQ